MAKAASRHHEISSAAAAGADILARVREVFDQRLDRQSRALLAVGFSGGGDSLALLLAARAWASETGRGVLALTVDHGLQPASAAWTLEAERTARALGLGFAALKWEGPKPKTGLPAAARRARHALLAEAARGAGARVILLGHTLDDVQEAARMRDEGSSVGAPRAWSPSPAWPEGRGVFLLRPLLGVGRAELRQRLAPAGLGWIEDPANEDLRNARARARRRQAGTGPGLGAGQDAPERPPAPALSPRMGEARWGLLRFDRRGLIEAGPRALAAACVCAGGGERLPRRESVDRLLDRLRSVEGFAATLAGARVEAAQEVLIARDVGRLAGSDQAEVPLAPGAVLVWDGRFEILADAPGWRVRPLRGLASRLEPEARRALRDVSPMARGGLPALTDDLGAVACPILAQAPHVRARTLVDARFAGACGGIAREDQIAFGSDGEVRHGALS